MGLASSLATKQLAARLAGATERAVDRVVELRGPAVERAARRLHEERGPASPDALARIAVARSGRRSAGAGAMSAMPATLPGIGTAVEVGAALGDASLLTVSQAELVLLIAHLHGRPLADVQGRRLDVFMAMGVEAGVVDLHRSGAVRVMGREYADAELRGEAGSKLAARISRRLAGQVAGRLARRRAHVILGREVPVVGIGLAAGYNLWSTRKLGGAARAYFRHIV